MTTTTALAMPHRTVLNVLNNSSGGTLHVANGAGVNVLMAYPDVDMDVIYGLVDGEFVTGPHRWAITYGLDPRSPGRETHLRCCVEQHRKQGEKLFNFRITDHGRWWVGGDPLSVLLGSVWMAPSRRMRLHEALGFSDRPTIVAAVDGGYLTACYADGHETQLRGDYEFRHARDFSLRATSKVRNVLG
jgi:hypothetical protein